MDDKKDTAPTSQDPVATPLGNEGESLDQSTLETGETEVVGGLTNPGPSGQSAIANTDNPKQSPQVINATTPGKEHKQARTLGNILKPNIYLLSFILVIIMSAIIVVVIYLSNRSNTNSPEALIGQQQLSPEALKDLAANGVQVGDPKQVLNVQSNSVFAGTVLVKGEMQVAGGIKIGTGNLTIPDMTVGGTAVINQLQAQSLAVAGNTAVQGQLTVQQSLSVNGTGNFNGSVTAPQVSTGRLQLSGDLVLSRHLVAGGAIPTRTNGGALGTGGTSSLSGSDTAGSIAINTGGGATSGCMVTVSFSSAFASTPHVMITPVGATAGSINHYIDRTTSSFSICSTSALPSNQAFGFDYFVVE